MGNIYVYVCIIFFENPGVSVTFILQKCGLSSVKNLMGISYIIENQLITKYLFLCLNRQKILH